MDFKIDNFEFVELRVIAGFTGQSIDFLDQPQLRGMRITAIETYSVNDIPASFKTGGLPVASIAQIQAASLVLYNSQKYGEQPIQGLQAGNLPINNNAAFKYGVNRIPLVAIHRIQNASDDPFVRELPQLVGNIIQWDKSSLFFSSPQTFDEDTCFVFGVYYPSNIPSQG
jgi:hypothetical protein